MTRSTNSSGGTQFGLFTAGHCGPEGTSVSWGGQNLGHRFLRSAWYDVGQGGTIRSDSAYMHINSGLASRWIYADYQSPAWQMRSVSRGSSVDDLVCLSGVKNPGGRLGPNCGRIITADRDLPICINSDGTDCRRVQGFFEVSKTVMDCESGDSGGSIYNDLEAVGIHMGHHPLSNDCFFTHIIEATAYHGPSVNID